MPKSTRSERIPWNIGKKLNIIELNQRERERKRERKRVREREREKES